MGLCIPVSLDALILEISLLTISHFRVALYPGGSFKTNLSYGNEFFLHVYCLANQTHFRIKGCAPELRRTRFEAEVKSNSEMAYWKTSNYVFQGPDELSAPLFI